MRAAAAAACDVLERLEELAAVRTLVLLERRVLALVNLERVALERHVAAARLLAHELLQHQQQQQAVIS